MRLSKVEILRPRTENCHSRFEVFSAALCGNPEFRVTLNRETKMSLPFKLVYSDDYYLPIGAHVFPAQKYRLIHQRLVETGVADAGDFIAPKPALDEDILLVHTSQYVQKLKLGTLSAQEEQQMEVPYSPELVKAFWLAAGGSILAADHALRDGVACNIGGGFHHAFPDHGEGFCVIHDVAVAIKRMHKDGKIHRAMTVDCDVHDGNGTAAIFPPQNRPGHPLPSASASQVQRDVQREVHSADGPGPSKSNALEGV